MKVGRQRATVVCFVESSSAITQPGCKLLPGRGSPTVAADVHQSAAVPLTPLPPSPHSHTRYPPHILIHPPVCKRVQHKLLACDAAGRDRPSHLLRSLPPHPLVPVPRFPLPPVRANTMVCGPRERVLGKHGTAIIHLKQQEQEGAGWGRVGQRVAGWGKVGQGGVDLIQTLGSCLGPPPVTYLRQSLSIHSHCMYSSATSPALLPGRGLWVLQQQQRGTWGAVFVGVGVCGCVDMCENSCATPSAHHASWSGSVRHPWMHLLWPLQGPLCCRLCWYALLARPTQPYPTQQTQTQRAHTRSLSPPCHTHLCALGPPRPRLAPLLFPRPPITPVCSRDCCSGLGFHLVILPEELALCPQLH